MPRPIRRNRRPARRAAAEALSQRAPAAFNSKDFTDAISWRFTEEIQDGAKESSEGSGKQPCRQPSQDANNKLSTTVLTIRKYVSSDGWPERWRHPRGTANTRRRVCPAIDLLAQQQLDREERPQEDACLARGGQPRKRGPTLQGKADLTRGNRPRKRKPFTLASFGYQTLS